MRSAVPEEQDYALHHLVKISHERGDKYKFEAFPGLAEGLIEKLLEVSSLFYNVKWEISYADDGQMYETHTLDGMNGTADILQRIQTLQTFDTTDEMETEEFSHKLTKINEAGLVIRNMSLLEDNAEYLSKQYPLRDFLSIALNLPHNPAITELRHYALDIAEQLTKYWSLDVLDPLYISLLRQLDGLDRGAILTTLRAISRISMNLDESNRLKDVPISVIKRLCEWTLLEDEELVHACLDFLYQFTAVPENVVLLLNCTRDSTLALDSLLSQLTRLLLFNAHEASSKRLVSPAVPSASATEIPTLPGDLVEQITKIDEPERSSHWLRACFEEDPDSDITQIALWQAYQSRFTEFSTPQNPLLPAAEFIKNVSTTFATANAQVIQGLHPKFIIKGIRPRHLPMDTKGRVYTRCIWKTPGSRRICGEFVLKPRNLWEHIVNSHIRIPQTLGGQYDFTSAQTATALQGQTYNCYWAGCRHFSAAGGTSSPYELGMHIKTHLPDASKLAGMREKHNHSLSIVPAAYVGVNGHSTVDETGFSNAEDILDDHSPTGRPATYAYQTWHNTAVDERGDAAGLPLTSVLVLRNLARNIPKAVIALDNAVNSALGSQGWMERLFGPLRGRLWYVMAHNRPLAGYVGDLMGVVERGISG